MVIFEVPTGVLADTWGSRTSYLLGAATLLVSTLLYLAMWRMHAPLWGWAIASVLLGLGFTFFSGATEAWLVDALAFSGFKEGLESVLARGQIVGGAAMLTGSVAGGLIAQSTNLGVPYVLRSLVLAVTLVAAFFLMKDLGFSPARGKRPLEEIRKVLRASIDNGWRNPPVRWLMLAGAVRRRGEYLCFLRAPAVPAPALWRPEGVRCCRAGGGHIRGDARCLPASSRLESAGWLAEEPTR